MDDALRVRQVARLLIRHADAQIAPHRQLAAGQQLGHVFDSGAQRPGALGPGRVVAEVVRVLLEHGPTTGRVDHDRAAQVFLERRDVALGQAPGAFEVSGVEVERPAAALASGVLHVAAGPLEDPDRAPIDLGERGRHDTAREERHAQRLTAPI